MSPRRCVISCTRQRPTALESGELRPASTVPSVVDALHAVLSGMAFRGGAVGDGRRQRANRCADGAGERQSLHRPQRRSARRTPYGSAESLSWCDDRRPRPLRCADGLVLASDSQITDPAADSSYPAQKLHPLGSHAAWAAAAARERCCARHPAAVRRRTRTRSRRGAGHRPRRAGNGCCRSSSTTTPISSPTSPRPNPARPRPPMSWRRGMPVRCRSSSTSTRTGSSATTKTSGSRQSAAAHRWPSRPMRYWPTSG